MPHSSKTEELARRKILKAILAAPDAEYLLQSYSDDHDRLRQAIEFMALAHNQQRRKSGELFAYHPLAVARILAEQGLSIDTIIAGLLHDTIEDTDKSDFLHVTHELIEQRFGVEIADIVEGLTKIVQIAERGSPKREGSETYRKLLLASTSDARVLVIKFADRLHNIRTIDSMPANRALPIAQETMKVYAPLAHRLGMSKVKEELEDRSLRVIDRQSWDEAGAIQKRWQGLSGERLTSLGNDIHHRLEKIGIDATVKTRVKSRRSISEKLRRRSAADEDIWDVLGIRILVDTPMECYQTFGLVHELWPPRFDRFHDYISVPKANLYQSLHTTVLAPGGLPVEVQIRTRQMDDIAENGIAAHWHYKETLREGGPDATKRFLSQAAKAQRSSSDLDEAFASLRDSAFEHEVYVFTPGGEVKVLPEGSTAVDFAYAVHTDIGDACVGCRIDGALKPLSRPLKNGETVDILKGPKGSHPSEDWLRFVKSTKARSKIKAYYRERMESEQAERGLKLLKNGLKNARLTPLTDEDKLTSILDDIGIESIEEASMEAARGDDHLQVLLKRITRQLARAAAADERAGEEPLPETKRRPSARPGKRDPSSVGVLVDNDPDIMVRLANCCNPEPGNDIIGYVSLARGVSIHRSDCRNMRSHIRDNSPRIKEATWAMDEDQSFTTRIEIVALDRPGYVADVAQLVHNNGSELQDIHLTTSGKLSRGYIVAVVASTEHAAALRSHLKALDGTINIMHQGVSED